MASEIKFCMSADNENIITGKGYVFSGLPFGSIRISKEQYKGDISGKRVVSLPEYDSNGNVTKDAVLEEVQA